MKTARTYLFVLAVSLCFTASAHADSVEGRVAGVDYGSLAMVVYDAQGRPYPNELVLQVDEGTEFINAAGTRALRRNDPIRVDAEQLENGAWRARTVERFETMSVQPATKRTPSAMQGFLGNPVARGALTGAATGAIAASASGGKAGKGALIGAGVGAAGGLLESIFSQPQQQPASDDQY